MLSIMKNLSKLISYGTTFTSDPILKGETEKSNIVFLASSVFILSVSVSNYFMEDYFNSVKLFSYVILLIINRVIFSFLKKIRIYSSIIIFIICFVVCEAIISGIANGAGIISIGVLITSVMYLSRDRFGLYLSVSLLLFEVFIILFNSKIDWIYTYPDYMEIYFLRFICAHIFGFVVSYFGIKKQKELYNEIKKEKELRARLFVNIVHDLKTPLTIIQNSFDQYLDRDNDENTKKLLKTNINRMEKNILNILNLDRLERGVVKNKKDIITNVSILTNEIADSFIDYAASRGIDIKVNIKKNLHINIDVTSYTELLNNLIENSIKYTKAGGKITVDLESHEETVTLIVSDTGIGIQKKDLALIFESYYQINNSLESYYGLGIGLSIVKEICETWDGSINVESVVGKGTTFKLLFPKIRQPKVSYPKYNLESYKHINYVDNLNNVAPLEYTPNKQTILIVEDNIDIRILLIKTFRENFNLVVANNGKEALYKYFGGINIDIIITDLMMPIMDGKDFLEELIKREGCFLLPVIVLTAKSEENSLIEHLSLGAIDYISKPFSANELYIKVESILSVFKSKQDKFIESISSNLINYISDNYTESKTPKDNKSVNYENLRKYSISPREQVIIEYIKQGLSYKDISYKEKISINTVKTYIYRIYKKSSINNSKSLIEVFYS